MELSNSDLLSGMALLVSAATALYTRRQTQHQSAANSTSYRSSLAENHRRYSDLLNQTIHRHKERHRELSRLAGEAACHVPHLLDDFDICRDSQRPLRHLVSEASEMVHLSFNGQLGWQTAENIHWRLGSFNQVEDRLDPQREIFSSDFRREFRQRYTEEPNRYEDHCLVTDRRFCGLVEAAQARLDWQRRGELLSTVSREVQTFAACHDKLRQEIREDAERLERALVENKNDEFDLEESPHLYRRIKFEIRRLQTLATLRLPQIDSENPHRYLNYTSLCIQICALLHIVQGSDMWEWGRFLEQ